MIEIIYVPLSVEHDYLIPDDKRKKILESVMAQCKAATEDLDKKLNAGWTVLHSQSLHASGKDQTVFIVHKPDGDVTQPAQPVSLPEDDEATVIANPDFEKKRVAARIEAKTWARDMKSKNAIYIDFETSGWGNGFTSEIIQVAAIDGQGNVLMDTLVKPRGIIQRKATSVHGITEDMVKDAPEWETVWDKLRGHMQAADVVIAYNSDFERSILQTALRDNMPAIPSVKWQDAMIYYAMYQGEWSESKQDWKWQKLTTACTVFAIDVEDKAHSAIGDTRRTLGLVNGLAALALEAMN